MDELDDLGTYNGNEVHDMWVDFDYQINTGELDYVSDDEENNIDEFNDKD